MRSKIFVQTVLLVFVATFAVTGCKAFKKKSGTGSGSEAGVPPLGSGGDIASGERPMAGGTWQEGQFTPVFFDYDSAKIKPSEMSKLSAVASAVKNSSSKLVVEGHCDERGTAEYNRALGERRAQAAREELVGMGVSADRISTISYGKERPADMGHEDTAWSRNRRCEFVVVGQ